MATSALSSLSLPPATIGNRSPVSASAVDRRSARAASSSAISPANRLPLPVTSPLAIYLSAQRLLADGQCDLARLAAPHYAKRHRRAGAVRPKLADQLAW